MKQFIKKIIILTMILAIIVGAVNYLYIKHSPNFGTMGECKNDDIYIVDVPEEIQICNFGNSHGYYGFNYDEYINELNCFNFSLPSQSMSYNYRILKNYQNHIASGAVVFICISYNSFFGEIETSATNFYAKNKRYYHFLANEYIKEYDFKTDIFVNYLPAFSVSLSNMFKTMLGISVNEDWWINETTPEAAEHHGAIRYETHVAVNVDDNGFRIYNEEEIEAVYQIIKLCQELGAIPVLITTPYLFEYTGPVLKNDPRFYEDFYGIIEQIRSDTGVEYYDYQFDERFISSYQWFFNADHLNKVGASEFTNILMQEIVYAKGYL